MKQFSEIAQMQQWRRNLSAPGRIGFVPTMGALHAGHRALIEQARAENAHVVVSIFVNPTQFNDANDWANYPQPLEADLALCREAGVDLCFTPTRDSLYPDNYRYRITEDQASRRLEGAFRPGHFDGVLTVVMKLLQIVRADRAYFGEKDWQQVQLVEAMAAAFFLDTQIIACPTVREADGLAMSSRNVRLSDSGRTLAAAFPRLLTTHADPEGARRALEAEGFAVEYVEDVDGRRLAAIVVEGVRLIDNFPWPLPREAAVQGRKAEAR